MAETSEGGGIKKAAPAGSEDHISALPDELLQQILSLLPSRCVVRTCVLATRWRTLWKSVPSLRINTRREGYESAYALSKFVNHLLLLRDRTPLRVCEIHSYDTDVGSRFRKNQHQIDEAYRYIELWLRYAVSCQVRTLLVDITTEARMCLSDVAPLLSQHLTRLELRSVEVGGHFLNFASCPALKMLKMQYCAINVGRISSQSLTHLIIDYGSFGSDDGRTRISVPSLIELEIYEFAGRTPLLEPMPSLVRAFFMYGGNCRDRCDMNYFGSCGSETCNGCSYSKIHDNDDCVILKGLSSSVNLELTTVYEWFIGRMDFKWHIIFSRLKTLVLDEWCAYAHFSGIIYFLQHSPILETLILELEYYEAEDGIEKEESYSPRSVSKHLKVVEITCWKEDETIHQIVKILGILGVSPECISINPHYSN